MNIKVVTSNGGIMELYSPITAECITNEFPGHRIFRTRNNNLFSQTQPQPLLHNEHLHPGQFYYLLPLTNTDTNSTTTFTTTSTLPQQEQPDTFHVNNNINGNYTATYSSMVTTPYRMSFDNQGQGQGQGHGQGQGGRGRGKRSSEAEVFPRYNSTGVWKVKLVISPDQLSEILSHDSRTEALIESVRTVAKCANGVPHSSSSSSSSSSSVANSDHCSSLSGNYSHWNHASHKL